MTLYLSCPICARLCYIEIFNPESYGLDIEVVEMRSLGRKGFEVTGRYSVLEDSELTGRIVKRMRDLLAFLEGRSDGVREGEEQLLDTIEELQDDNRQLCEELAAARSELERVRVQYHENQDNLLSTINDALEYVDPFSDIGSAVQALVGEYEDALEELGDLSS